MTDPRCCLICNSNIIVIKVVIFLGIIVNEPQTVTTTRSFRGNGMFKVEKLLCP